MTKRLIRPNLYARRNQGKFHIKHQPEAKYLRIILPHVHISLIRIKIIVQAFIKRLKDKMILNLRFINRPLVPPVLPCKKDNACNEVGVDYGGNDIAQKDVTTAEECSCFCQEFGEECKIWTFKKGKFKYSCILNGCINI